MKTKPASTFVKFGIMKVVHRRKGSGEIQIPGSVWATGNRLYFHSNWSGRTTRACAWFEGLGVNGAIISMVFGEFGLIGEIVTCESTGRTIIWCLKDYTPIIRVGPKASPMEARYQAVQIAAFNWWLSQNKRAAK